MMQPFPKCNFLKTNPGNNFLLEGLRVCQIAKTKWIPTWGWLHGKMGLLSFLNDPQTSRYKFLTVFKIEYANPNVKLS